MKALAKTVKLPLAAIVAATFLLTSCARSGEETGDGPEAGGAGGFESGSLIGVALSSDNAGAESSITKEIKESNFEPEVQVAADTAEQQQQINSLLEGSPEVLIVDAVDPAGLVEPLEAAQEAKIPVVALDSLVTGTDAVEYIVTADAFKTGEVQAQALLEGLAAQKDQGPYNVELFSGPADDGAARLAFDGAMTVLQPKIDDGTVAVVSGQTDFEATASENPDAAAERLAAMLDESLASDDLHGVLAGSDATAEALMAAAEDAGKEAPVVVGSGSSPEAVKSIMADGQYATTYADTEALAIQVVSLVSGLSQDDAPDADDEDSYDNGQTTVGAYLVEPKLVTKETAPKVFAQNKELLQLVQ
ncbi:MAG: substrate-binding domain-containing protein [Actinomycetota bacterium]